MKSCNKLTKTFNIKNTTLIITIVFTIMLITLYFMYNYESKYLINNNTNNNNAHNDNANNNNANNNNVNNNNVNNIKLKLQTLITKGDILLQNTINNDNDKFEDVLLPIKLPNSQNIKFEDLNEEQKIILQKHRYFFNDDTSENINEFDIKTNTNIEGNLSNLVYRYNNYNNEINNTIQDINYDLLKQLQKNYALAHKVNIKRNIDLQDIDNLPQRFD